MTSNHNHADLALMECAEARRLLTPALAGRMMSFSVLHPVYPAVGCGKLRVLRIRETGEHRLEMIAGYESYERIDS